MRRAAVLVALACGLGLTPWAPGSPSSPVAAAPSDPIAIVVEGTGFGHGRGMSQWGAYGWAVDQSKSWQWILDHYYGGTTLGDVNTAQARIKVRLLGQDGATTVGVFGGSGNVTAGGVSRRSLYAKEVSTNTFEIWGSTAVACPVVGSSLTVPSGTVQRGSSDAVAVRQIQTFLNAYQGGTPLAVDGQFGPATEQRLREWQVSRALANDGIWHAADATSARAQIAASTSSVGWTKLATVAGPVTFTTANGDTSSAAPGAVLGLCDAAGRVTHYRGKITVNNVPTSANTNWIVNDVKTEDYLRGVVPKEISASWADAGGGKGANAVRAQAVAARSYGLQQQRYAPYATICDSQSCQVYLGSATRAGASGAATSVEDARTDAAIIATAGKVRLKNGAVVATEFSASNGPRTAGGAFPPVDDTLGDRTDKNPNHRWTRVLDASAVAQKYGLGAVTSATMTESSNATYRQFDGIWFNDVLLNGATRVDAWKFRGDFGLPSPGFTIRVVTRDTTTKTFGFIGDSVGNGIAGSPVSEFSILTDGMFASARMDMQDSRCTVNTTCPGTSGVEAAAKLPLNLDLAVVELGYNDWTPDMATAIDTMMRALQARGVRQVAWVNMASATGISPNAGTYGARNAALAAATTRWPNLAILDWNAASNTAEKRRWFASDGVHLTATGDAKFALWLREQVRTLTPPSRLAPPRRIEIPVVGKQVTAPDGSVSTIPANAAAVSLNLTTVGPDDAGFATVWPCGVERPLASSVNYERGAIDSNGVIAPVGANGKVCVYSHKGTDVVVDVAGWFTAAAGAGSGLTAITPLRIADTREGVGLARARITPGRPVSVQITGKAATGIDGRPTTIPANAVAAAINVTAVKPSGEGYITVWPCGRDRPLVSTLNFSTGAIRANGAIANLGDGGKICIYSHASSDVVVDVAGWFTGAAPTETSAFVSSVPERWVDTREGLGAPARQVSPTAPLQIPVVGRKLTVDGRRVAVPAGAEAVAINVTVVGPREPGFATVWPCGTTRPTTSNVNYPAGQITANNVIAPLGSGGAVCLHVHTTSHVVVDVAGWFNAGDGFQGFVPNRFVDSRIGLGPSPV